MTGVLQMFLAGGSVLTLNDLTQQGDDQGLTGEAAAGYKVKSDGTVEAGTSGDSTSPTYSQFFADTDWIRPEENASDAYEVRATLDSGDSPTSGSAVGSWLALSSTRTWEVSRTTNGTTTSNLTIEIRAAGSGRILASASVTIEATVSGAQGQLVMARKKQGVFGKGYDTMEDAARATLEYIRSQPEPDKNEYAAGIWKDEETGKYYRTQLATSRSRGHVSGEEIGKVINNVPNLAGLRGMVHNHPSGPKAALFSQADLQQIQQIAKQIRQVNENANIGSFLEGMEEGGAMGAFRRIRPEGDHKTVRSKDMRDDSRQRTFSGVRGEEFLAQFPIDEFTSRLAKKILGRSPTDERGMRREVVPTRGSRNVLARN